MGCMVDVMVVGVKEECWFEHDNLRLRAALGGYRRCWCSALILPL